MSRLKGDRAVARARCLRELMSRAPEVSPSLWRANCWKYMYPVRQLDTPVRRATGSRQAIPFRVALYFFMGGDSRTETEET